MKTVVSLVLLLASLSVGAVGVGYALRRSGEGGALPGPAAPTTPTTVNPPATIAIGEPVPGSGGFVLAGSTASPVVTPAAPATLPVTTPPPLMSPGAPPSLTF